MLKKSKFTKAYFIKKFKAIPSKEIGLGCISKHCALWHCGARIIDGSPKQTEETTALIQLFSEGQSESNWHCVYRINDDIVEHIIKGTTPKTRILNKLKSL